MDATTISQEHLQTYNAQKQENKKQSKTSEEINLDETFEKSAVSVHISMNAQSFLMQLESYDYSKTTTLTQSSLSTHQEDVLNFLSGNEASNGLSLKDIGYEGKPILELSSDEAQELISEDGFFGVTNTSNRVANFVFSFAGDNLELLQKGKEGVIQGFEEAKRLFGDHLPEISYQTQNRTLQLIDEKIKEVEEK